MSKQLAVSAAFSVFAMAAFVLFATPANQTGAKAEAFAPAFGRAATALPLIGD